MSYETFDAHTHFFSHSFFKTLVLARNESADVDTELAALEKKLGIHLPDQDIRKHTQKWLTELDDNEVSSIVTFASLPQEMESISEAVKNSNGRIVGYTLVNPISPEAPDFVEKAVAMGMKGLLLFPVMHHYHPSDPQIYPTLEIAQKNAMPVIVHLGMLEVKLRDIIGLPREYDMKFGNPIELQITANRFPGINFIIPHFGCGFLRETLMVGSLCENIYVDTSSSNSWMNTQVPEITLKDVFEKVENVFGAERILFGTDSSVFPRGWRKDIYNSQLRAMQAASFSESKIRNVLAENIKRLLEL